MPFTDLELVSSSRRNRETRYAFSYDLALSRTPSIVEEVNRHEHFLKWSHLMVVVQVGLSLLVGLRAAPGLHSKTGSVGVPPNPIRQLLRSLLLTV